MNRYFKETIILILKTIMFLSMMSLLFGSPPETGSLDYLKSIKKIDVHTHIRSDAPYLREIMDDWNFKFCTVCTRGMNVERMNLQINSAKEYTKEFPRYYAWITTFDLTQRDEPGWVDNVIKRLKDDFENGAVGVKIWKEIGMEIKNADGKYIQSDDPMFDPIYEFIAQEGKTLITHLGEPISTWMPNHVPVEGMPLLYAAKHPQYHFYNKPDLPSYSAIMAARDNILEKHPDLKFVGAHLASLEFDVDEIAKRMDRYPNFAVGIGGRTRYLMWQARGKVREFFIKYQDRILYGTDRTGGKKETQEEIEAGKRLILDRHDMFFRYYATDEDIPWGSYIYGGKPWPKPTYTVKGLALPKEVLNKLFYDNAVNWFPGVNKEY